MAVGISLNSAIKGGCVSAVTKVSRIFDEGFSARRSIADALDVLRLQAGFSDQDTARIWLGPLPLPSGRTAWMLSVNFEGDTEANHAFLPASVKFTGIREGATSPEILDTSILQGAIVDDDAHVLLVDGTRLRAVNVKPANLPLEPSDIDWRIVELTIEIAGAQKRCYRRFTDKQPHRLRRIRNYSFPRRLHRELRDVKLLDCRALRGLDVPPLKLLGREIGLRDSSLKNLSRPKLANTLAIFGVNAAKARARPQCR